METTVCSKVLGLGLSLMASTLLGLHEQTLFKVNIQSSNSKGMENLSKMI